MSWPNLADAAVFTTLILFCVGIANAIIQGRFNKPKAGAETDHERALAKQVEIDANIKLIEMWMTTNQKLLESNNRLEKSNERLQKYGERMQKEMKIELADVKQATKALVDVIDRLMPMFAKVLTNDNDIQELDAALRWARSVNNGDTV